MVHKKNENGNSLPAVFTYGNQKKVNAIIIDEDPWFIAKNITDILGLEHVNKAVQSLDDDERKIFPGVDSLGRKNKMIFINESGLYNLIFRSSKPEAKKFRKWVTVEVLPALRKTGKYQVADKSISAVKQEYSKTYELIDAATTLLGSHGKLAARLSISPAVFSHIVKRPWLVSDSMVKAIETGCRNIIANKNHVDTEAIEALIMVSDEKARITLYNKLKKGGLL